jgi:hypothetical protein
MKKTTKNWRMIVFVGLLGARGFSGGGGGRIKI